MIYNNKTHENYEGQWLNNKPSGYGVYHYLLNDKMNKYMGEFNDGLKEGFGIFEYSDGQVYEGEWFNDKKEGMGILTFADGSKYQGMFSDDRMTGSNLKEIAQVRTWIDDYDKFEESNLNQTKTFLGDTN